MKPLYFLALLFLCTTLPAQKELRLHPDELDQLDNPETRRDLRSLKIEGRYNDTLRGLPLSMIYLDSLVMFEIEDVEGMDWKQLYATLATLPQLRIVIIDGGYGSGDLIIPELAALQQITSLDISGNFSDLPLDPVYTLTNLEELSLGACGIDSVSSRIANLKKLTRLDLGFNHFDQPLPAEIGQLKNLRELQLTDCGLRTFPAFIPQLTNLEVLELGHNWIKEIPNEIVRLTKLRRIELAWNRVTELPPGMEAMDSLKYLDVSLNRIRKLPAGLAGCAQLRELYCWSSHFNEKDPVLEVLIFSRRFGQKKLNDTIANYYSKKIDGWSLVFADGTIMYTRKKFHQDVTFSDPLTYRCTPELTNDVTMFDNEIFLYEFNRWRERKNPAFGNVEALHIWYDYPVLPLGYHRYSAIERVEIEREVLWMSSEHLLRPLKDNPVSTLIIHDPFMRKLPRCIRKMKELEKLTLNCPGVKELPEWLAELPNLRELKIHKDVIVPDAVRARVKISYF